MERTPREKAEHMANIIIVGCGRVGSQLATLLSQSEDNVMVIDKNA